MKDIEYAFCVARIRANESNLLTTDFINKLIEVASYYDAVRMLEECGWIIDGESISDFVKMQNTKLWELLKNSVPDKNELNVLCVVNDYFNIKTAVKCALTGENPENYFVQPTTIDAVEVYNKIKVHDFSNLPESISVCAELAYAIAERTENGQNADIIVDKAALEVLLKYGAEHKDRIFSKICSFVSDTLNMKIALRCAETNKNSDFAETAISDCVNLDKKRLVELCTADKDALYEYLLSSVYSKGAEIYSGSPSAFDKWCDDEVINIAKDAKFTSFGFAPVCAYYYAKQNEIKTVRIILSAKLSAVSKELIKERVRDLYV